MIFPCYNGLLKRDLNTDFDINNFRIISDIVKTIQTKTEIIVYVIIILMRQTEGRALITIHLPDYEM